MSAIALTNMSISHLMWPIYIVQANDNRRQFEAPNIRSDHHFGARFGSCIRIRGSE